MVKVQRPLVYALDLHDDPVLIERYRAWHSPGAVPPAVTRSIRAAGIDAMEIFLCGNRLVLLLWPGEEFDPIARAVADAADPAVQEWEKRMDEFQQRLPFADAGVKWVPMDRIYYLPD